MPAVDYVFPNDELGDISQNIVTLYHRQQKAKNSYHGTGRNIKHFQYSKEGFAMFTSEGREILSNILFIQFINVISDTQIHQVEDVTDKPN